MITARLHDVSHIPSTFLTETPPAPKSVKVEISSRCNFRCKYCALANRNGERGQDIDFDLFQRICKEALDYGSTEFGVFYIGESFTSPDLLIKCIRYLKDIGAPYTFLTTNGSLATKDHIHACMEAGLDSLKFSNNFADGQQFAELTGVKSNGAFNSVIQNMRDAFHLRNEHNYKTKFYSSSIMYDPAQESRMAPFLKENVLPYVDEHYWLPLFNETAMFKQKRGIGNVGNYHDPAPPIPCWTIFTACHVMADGRVSACCHDAVGHWTMGDLKADSFESVWHSEEYRKLRRAHLNNDVMQTKCKDCIDTTIQIGH